MKRTAIPPADDGDMMGKLFDITRLLTIPCKDDGEEFTVRNKISAMEWLLSYREWCILGEGNLCRIVSHKRFDWNKPFVLLSSHCDEVYTNPWVRYASSGHWIGTLDNSITNAVAMYCALEDRLPVQTLIAFTGDEEEDSRGVPSVLSTIGTQRMPNLKLVVVMDVTDLRFGREAFTVENVSLLNKEAVFKQLCITEFPALDSREDEACAYAMKGLPVFSLGLPCAPYSEFEGINYQRWMHWDCGFKVRPQDVIDYTRKIIDISERTLA